MRLTINETSPVPIYEQIEYGIIQMIAFGDYSENDKLPSVRDLAVFLKVNPNTVARAFSELSSRNIIYVKRGIGNFIVKGAKKTCRKSILEKIRNTISRELDTLEIAGFSKKEITNLLKEIRSEK